MLIEIKQADNGTDTVTINGEAVSEAVASIVLGAIDAVETQQHAEANASWEEHHCSFCGKPLVSGNQAGFCGEICYYSYTEGGSSSDQYGPEDGGCCTRCGGVSCDGTC